jgi:hypothetical protein
MEKPIKQELHELVDKCDKEYLLDEAKAVLENDQAAYDWWDELTEEDKNVVKESEVEYGRGNYISHEELLKRFEEWRNR